jgi:lipopolysaccharide biosynthesis regulator YciM
MKAIAVLPSIGALLLRGLFHSWPNARLARWASATARSAVTARPARPPALHFILGIALALGAIPTTGTASDLEDARELLRLGKYDAFIELSRSQVEKKVWNEAWPRYLIEGYLITGDYAAAMAVYEGALERFGDSLRLRMLGAKVYQFNNEPLKAKAQLVEMEAMLQRAPWRYSNRSELVPLGEFFLSRGEDPKQVLKLCFDQATKVDPNHVEAYVATARMALDKNDAQVASQVLTQALKRSAQDPEIHYLSALAWATDDERATGSLKKSLEINPRYIPSLLLLAESSLNAENYTAAAQTLSEIEAINPRHPRMWALRAVINHLTGDHAAEGISRRQALDSWKLNPEVDHTIGKHLSLHYRFAEGVEYQRRALSMDPNYAPANSQLAQDLLRLGETDAGWSLVDGIRQSDPYDVSIFNLKQLQARLAQFTTIEIPGFVIRMDAAEAEVYGADVAALLTEARQQLVPKYQADLQDPTYVEIFPRQQEFAIRTFGLPGGQGFLGVCFGRLITANSPAALNVDSNWKSVLWHEYCHVVTLQKTKNKMPRWLSEGISVYEERTRDATWGEQLDPIYREMLLSDDLVPISQLSGAFLRPKSPLHLQFAYYTSSLAVEFWIEQFGMPGLQQLLRDLSMGMKIEEALTRLPGSLESLDTEFLRYARDQANRFASSATFERLPKNPAFDLASWLTENPNSYWGWKAQLDDMIQSKEWERATEAANRLAELWPQDHSENGIYSTLATIHRERSQPDQERQALVQLAQHAAAPTTGLLRLAELDSQSNDWNAVALWCERLQAIQPMRFEVQSLRADAAEKLDNPALAARALTALTQMNPADPSGIYFRLAKSFKASGDPARAKRYCLMSLEESPRFAEAIRLLMELPTAPELLSQPQGTPPPATEPPTSDLP